MLRKYAPILFYIVPFYVDKCCFCMEITGAVGLVYLRVNLHVDILVYNLGYGDPKKLRSELVSLISSNVH